MKRKIRWAGLAAMTLAALPVLGAVQNTCVPQCAQSEEKKPDLSSILTSWPENSRVTARKMIDKYGPPDAVGSDRLVWNDHGKWTQIRVLREGVSNNFPTTHKDIVENTIQYDVPQDKAGELPKFYSGLSVDRLAGTLTARSDSEEANTVALNLANEIVTNKRDVDSARVEMRGTMSKSMAGKSSPYTDGLMFPVSDRGPVKR